MFDLLKKKFKTFTDKILKNTTEKQEDVLSEEQTKEEKQNISEEQIKDKEQILNEEQTKEEKSILNTEQTKNKEQTKDKFSILSNKETLEEKIENEDSFLETKNVSNTFFKDTKNVVEPSKENTIVKSNNKEINLEKTTTIEENISEKSHKEKTTQNLGQTTTPISPPEKKPSFFNLFKSKKKEQTSPKIIVPLPKANIDSLPKDSEKPLPSDLKSTVPIDPKPETPDDLVVKKTTELKKSFTTSIKSIFTTKIKLSEKEISSFLEEFELSLLEADVSIVSAENIIFSLKENLLNASFSKENLLEDIKQTIRDALVSQLNIDCNIDNYIEKAKEENKPFVILFIGPNGAGKTTTISKFAYHYKKKNHSVVLASSDTFRAGSIDQLEKHADNIGVKIIKQNYGSDPAAVAFDALTFAKKNNYDYVLIDTAGRQENNINLMQELKKIKKVVSPNLTIYIGEAQAGQAIVDQILGFEKEIGIDGVILTKLDTDPKGGVSISILNELKKPIFYVGTGQTYDDLFVFSSQFIIDRVVV